MDKNSIIESGGFHFIHNFDSGNLGHVERVPPNSISNLIPIKALDPVDYEFNLWTRPDCAGTEFENANRTWFYFGIQPYEANVLVRLNLLNLNKQTKMYNQGMAPVTRTLPGKPQWERIRDRPIHASDDNTFTLSFKYRTADNLKATTFFAFTYPYSFAELQIALNSIDIRMLPMPPPLSLDEIYYWRECLTYSLEGRRVDLLTISSHHGLTGEREEKLQHLFPGKQERAFKFKDKKIIFISARVHPGETPSSFVFNGFLNLLLNRHDPVAIQLRKLYVFKMIPFLNPDGVARGNYRTDTRGVNLNRVYLNPSLVYHPTVFAARALIRYYHHGCEKEDTFEDAKSYTSRSMQNMSESSELIDTTTKKKKQQQNSVSNSLPKEAKKTSKGVEVKPEPYKGLTAEAATLAEQVCDLKLQDSNATNVIMKESKTTVCDQPSILNDNVLRTCLGSEVHVTTSDQLKLQGPNPLRPLRNTLKDSISLLMECNSGVFGDNNSVGVKESRLSNVKLGWCGKCRIINRVEEVPDNAEHSGPQSPRPTSPNPPGYSASPSRTKYADSIEEYREHQRQHFIEMERKALEQTTKDNEIVHYCTNCFKQYAVTNREDVKVSEKESVGSIAASGDSGSSAGSPTRVAPQPGTGDTLQSPPENQSQRPQAGTNRLKVTPEHSLAVTKEDKTRIRKKASAPPKALPPREVESGLFLYIDLHGHASKKGIFMYGNYFDDLDNSVECMLLPRIMSLNNMHFHFSSCNFTERNMYLKDRRDGMSREGSGRVAVLKATGLVRSYTLECNYNTGRMVNVLPPRFADPPGSASKDSNAPPKYTPAIFEEVGRSLATSILDLTGHNPNSRVPCSEHRNLASLREWLRAHTRSMRPQLMNMTLRPSKVSSGSRGKLASPSRTPLYSRKLKATDERKENAYNNSKMDVEQKSHATHVIPIKLVRNPAPGKTPSRTKYLVETEPKPKSLSSKRRSILAIRKPSSSKSPVTGKGRGRQESSSKVCKRGVRRARGNFHTTSSSSGSEGGAGATWGDRGVTVLRALAQDSLKRRPFPTSPPHAAALKKIRLRTAI